MAPLFRLRNICRQLHISDLPTPRHLSSSSLIDHFPRRILFTCAILAAFAIAGCGPGGPQRFQLSGEVSYNGEPVPAGEISFTPDSSQGNTGPGAVAIIKAGRYETEPGKGVVGGPHTVKISGFDGKVLPESDIGVMLFKPSIQSADLPRESGEFNFTVPKE